MRVLGIESSCDETGIALYDSEKGLVAHALYSQIELHAEYGGVVPELASRDHIRKTLPLIEQVLNNAQLKRCDIDAVAYTAGPGLVGALLVGASIGKSIAWALGVPALAINHMEGHLLSPLLEDQAPDFPFISLLVSGGHTLLVDVKGVGQYELLGESIDDAVGEAFDKTAKMLGLSYPGGLSPEAILANSQLQNIIEKTFQNLPAMQRAALTLSDMEGFKIDEICNILDISSSNARVLLHRARAAIHHSIEQYQDK